MRKYPHPQIQNFYFRAKYWGRGWGETNSTKAPLPNVESGALTEAQSKGKVTRSWGRFEGGKDGEG